MDMPARIASKFDRGPGCWVWHAARDPNGYGRVRWNNRVQCAHRAVYEILVGPIPSGLHIDHLCRNKSCVNPAHLEPVTRQENYRRGVGSEKTRERNAAITHCPQGHPYDEANTYVSMSKGRPNRLCRACRLAYDRRRRGRQAVGSRVT